MEKSHGIYNPLLWRGGSQDREDKGVDMIAWQCHYCTSNVKTKTADDPCPICTSRNPATRGPVTTSVSPEFGKAFVNEVEKTLLARGKRYGDVDVQADVFASLMTAINHGVMGNPRERQSMVMICLKLSRLVAGDTSDADTWHDIAGYARLAVGDRKFQSEEEPE
jgi:hypothetical protein